MRSLCRRIQIGHKRSFIDYFLNTQGQYLKMKEPKPSEYASVVLQGDEKQLSIHHSLPSERIQSDIVIIHSTDQTVNEAQLQVNALKQTRLKIRCLIATVVVSVLAAILFITWLTFFNSSQIKDNVKSINNGSELLSGQPIKQINLNSTSKTEDNQAKDVPIHSSKTSNTPKNEPTEPSPILTPVQKDLPTQTQPNPTPAQQDIPTETVTNPIPVQKDEKPKNPSVNEGEHVYDCFAEQYLAHYYDPNQNIMYYRTTYDIFMPTCFHSWETILGHQDMEKWEREREVIEWARKNVRRGDSVFYDCQACRNFLDIVMLSMFVGSKGRLYIGQQMRNDICFPRVKLLHQLNNVDYLNRNQNQQRSYNVLISKNQASFRKRNLNEDMTSSPPLIILAQLSANSDILNPVINNPQVTISRVTLNSSNCKSTIVERPINGDFREGYFSVMRNDYQPRKEQDLSSKRENPLLLKYRKQYQEFRPTVPSPSQKKDITKIHQKFPIKLSQLSIASEQEGKQWLAEKQIIQWVRNRTNASSKIYYQYHSEQINLLAVLNIGAIVPQGEIFIHCSEQSWARITSHAQSLELRNVKRADRLSEELLASCQLFITDNLENVRLITKEGSFGNKLLLGYFTEDISESKELLYKLYPHYHIRKVAIKPSFYYGYEIFDNFFWHCEHPKGFFEIQQKTYVIFTFWIQAISEITPGRRYDIQEMVRMNTPEIKVINLIVLPYFIPEDQPFHKAYQFLSVVHKSDYLRCYFLYVYGGGYHDMKHIHYDMITYFKKLEEGPADMYAYGFRFMTYIFPPCLNGPNDPPCSEIYKNQFNLLGAQVQIHKYRNPIINSYFQKVHRILDEKYESLKRNPAGHPRDRIGFSYMQNGRMVSSGYPLRWEQICAEAYRNAQLQNFQHYYLDMPFIIMSDYK